MGHFLPLVIENVAPVADEIVVLDSGSTDGSQELLDRDERVRWSHRPFGGDFAAHKNAVIEQARGDWILLLDSDELLGEGLLQRLRRMIRTRWYSHFKLPRYWLVPGLPWRHLGGERHYPDWQLRLFRNTPFWRYTADRPVHEHFPRRGRGRLKRARQGHLFHFNFLLHGRSAREAKVRRYEGFGAESGFSSGVYLYEQAGHPQRVCDEVPAGVRAEDVARAVKAAQDLEIPVTRLLRDWARGQVA
jgi:glycosyltransferase involved in cell wall biosynthesis